MLRNEGVRGGLPGAACCPLVVDGYLDELQPAVVAGPRGGGGSGFLKSKLLSGFLKMGRLLEDAELEVKGRLKEEDL